MSVIKSVRAAVRHLREQPILFVPLVIYALLQVPQMFLESIEPMASMVVSLLFTSVFIFLTPLVYAGAVGMANDAATGTRTSLGRFWRHATDHYVSVLVGYLFLTALSFGFGIGISIAIFAAFLVGAAGEGGLVLTAAAASVVLLFVVAFLVAMFAIHFFTHAIVIEDHGAIDGLSRSVHVVRHNLRPVVGYGVIALALGAATGGLYAGIVSLTFPSAPAPGEPAPVPELLPALLGSGGIVAVSTLFATFFAAFSVVFYRDVTGLSTASPGRDEATAT